MASGIDHIEEGDPVWTSDTVTMLFGGGAQDMAGFAEANPAVARPVEVFNYSSAPSVILSDILADTLTTSPTPHAPRDPMPHLHPGRMIQPPGLHALTPAFQPNAPNTPRP